MTWISTTAPLSSLAGWNVHWYYDFKATKRGKLVVSLYVIVRRWLRKLAGAHHLWSDGFKQKIRVLYENFFIAKMVTFHVTCLSRELMSTVDCRGEQLLTQCRAKVERLYTPKSWIRGYFWSWNIRCDRLTRMTRQQGHHSEYTTAQQFPLLDTVARQCCYPLINYAAYCHIVGMFLHNCLYIQL